MAFQGCILVFIDTTVMWMCYGRFGEGVLASVHSHQYVHGYTHAKCWQKFQRGARITFRAFNSSSENILTSIEIYQKSKTISNMYAVYMHLNCS